MLEKMKGLVVEEEGQSLVEYGLIVGLIAVVVIGILATIGTDLQGVFQGIADKLEGKTTP